MCYNARRRLLRTYPGLLASDKELVTATNDTTYHARKDHHVRKSFSKWLFVADPILNDDNCRIFLIYCWPHLLGNSVLIDGFVATDNVIKGSPGFSGGPQDCSTSQANGPILVIHHVRALRYLGEDAQCAPRDSHSSLRYPVPNRGKIQGAQTRDGQLIHCF